MAELLLAHYNIHLWARICRVFELIVSENMTNAQRWGSSVYILTKHLLATLCPESNSGSWPAWQFCQGLRMLYSVCRTSIYQTPYQPADCFVCYVWSVSMLDVMMNEPSSDAHCMVTSYPWSWNSQWRLFELSTMCTYNAHVFIDVSRGYCCLWSGLHWVCIAYCSTVVGRVACSFHLITMP